MESVHLLQHLHVHPDGDEDYRLVGVYGSRSRAISAMEQLSAMPGFREFSELVSDVGELGPRPDGGSGFYLVEQMLDQTRFGDGFEIEAEAEADPLDHAPMPLMTADEQLAADSLGTTQLQAIDQAILAEAGPRWHKVTRIVGNLMGYPEFSDIPPQLYVQRIERLAGRGDLESHGDLRRIRYSEVRRPAVSTNVAVGLPP